MAISALGLAERLYGGAPAGLEPALCVRSRSARAACYNCVQACPAGALALPAGGGPPTLDAGRCTGCGQCQAACPTAAITVRDVNLDATLAALGDGPVAAIACRAAGAAGGVPTVPCLGAPVPEWLAAAAMDRTLVLQAPEPAACRACTLRTRPPGRAAAEAAVARANTVGRRAFFGLAGSGLRSIWAAAARGEAGPPAALPDWPAAASRPAAGPCCGPCGGRRDHCRRLRRRWGCPLRGWPRRAAAPPARRARGPAPPGPCRWLPPPAGGWSFCSGPTSAPPVACAPGSAPTACWPWR